MEKRIRRELSNRLGIHQEYLSNPNVNKKTKKFARISRGAPLLEELLKGEVIKCK